MNLVHLTASTFFGGPERQMLGLALAMPEGVRTTFATFPEGGRGGSFLTEVRRNGFAANPLKNDFPKIFPTVREVVELLRTTFASFPEGGRCHAFLDEVRRHDFASVPLQNDFPKLLPTVR